jgi:molybdenum cofactor cytidylyltransferase
MSEATRARIAGVVLAAGASTRMGRPKLLLTYQGVPLLQRALDAATQGGCDEVIVVVGANRDQYAQQLAQTAARIVFNPYYAEGLSTSIRAGIEALSEDVGAVVVLVADQPFIDGKVVRQLIETYRTSGKRIVTCEYEGVRGVPTLFDRALFIELLVLEGDRGARAVVEAYPRHVATVEIPPWSARDIDTPADAKGLLSR